jgi:tetratricopeptide (TPR) repeat protein
MTNAVPCLDPETIAAYLDRRLEPAEHARVEQHLADCEECRTLMSETALFMEADAAAQPVAAAVSRPARRTWVWSAAAAAAAVLALTPLVLRQVRPTPESALRELDRALDGKRYIEGQISGFEHGALQSPTRSATVSPDTMSFDVLAAASRVETLVGNSNDADDLAALGASQLAVGRVESAVRSLEHAARVAPANARVQSDLAVAYLARFRTGFHSDDPARALASATTALTLDSQFRAAAFNRALALEMLQRPNDALRAWIAYIELDPSSSWSEEARARIENLQAIAVPREIGP